MKPKVRLLLLLIPIFSAVYLNGQVTIGSEIPPEEAALLDIKSRRPDAAGEATTDSKGGGLLLPRVNLTNINDLAPFIVRATNDQKLRHTGLVVYNLTSSGSFEPGIYIWDGSKWKLTGETKNNWSLKGNLNTNPGPDYIGTADSKDLIIKTSGDERIRITADGKIGINTKRYPEQEFEVTGNAQLNNLVFLGNTPKAEGAKVSQLVIDNESREVFYVSSSTGNNYTFNYITYTVDSLQTGDWIADLDTQIPIKDYTLIVVGSSFDTNPQNSGLIVSPGSVGSGATYNSQSVYAFPKGTTWRLSADFEGGQTASGWSGKWHIQCIAINNSVVQTIPNISVDLQGKNSGQVSKPTGL